MASVAFSGIAGARIDGLEQVISNINSGISKIFMVTEKGLITAGLFLQGEAQKLTPVDTGNLKASAFTLWYGSAIPAPTFNTVGLKRTISSMEVAKIEAIFQQAIGQAQGVIPNPKKSDIIRVVVSYGAYYALFVHEDVTQPHDNGQAKFLETVAKMYAQNIILMAAGRIRQALKGVP